MNISYLGHDNDKILADDGQDLLDFAKVLIQATADRGESVVGTFSHIDFAVAYDSQMTPDLVLKIFYNAQARHTANYRMFHNGANEFQKSELIRQASQKQMYLLTDSLSELDFSNLEDVLDWCLSFYNANGEYDRIQVRSIFKKHGYDSSSIEHERYDRDDVSDFAKYLIQHAISKDGSLWNMLPVFVLEWKQKFGHRKLADEKRIAEIERNLRD